MKHASQIVVLAPVLALLLQASIACSGREESDASQDSAAVGLTSLSVKAHASTAAGIGARMEIYVDGQQVGARDVATATNDYVFTSPRIHPGAKVDVYFANDAVVNGEDRNLFVESLSYNGASLMPTGDTTYDRGWTYALATDGLDVVSGRVGMAWSGALRFALPNAAPAPAPTPTPTTAPPPPSPTIAPEDVPLLPKVSAVQENYAMMTSPPYVAVNNTWAVKHFASRHDWSQQVGVSAVQPDGSVTFRMRWDFPFVAGEEVLSYPEIVYGQAAGIAPASGAKLPIKVSGLNGLTTSAQGVVQRGTLRGQGHLSYDLWTSTTPADLATAHRRAEIMLPIYPFGGYGVPDSGPGAVGRGCGVTQTCTGRGGTFIERKAIGGSTYDVYYTAAGAGLPWQFIVLEPTVFPNSGPHHVEWKPVFDYLRQRGWVTDSDYLNSVELGVEPVSSGSGPAGDITVSGFKVAVTP